MIRSFFSLVLLAALLTGCRKQSQIQVYRVSKAPLEDAGPEQGNAMPTNAGSPGMPNGMAQTSSPAVPTPPNWQPQRLSEMRQASYLVKGENGATVDISLVGLGPAAGNVLENVNRWLSQLGQPAVNEEQLTKIAERLPTSIGDVTVVDLKGLPNEADPKKDGRIVAAMVGTDNSTLFFKMRGNEALTEAQKPDFIKWVAAVCDAQGSGAPSQVEAMAPAESAPPQLKWKTPEGWTEVPGSAMRYASFTASGANGDKADISIVTFPGTGGSDVDNVNRWRQQIGLPPVDESSMASLVAPVNGEGVDFSTLDMTAGTTRVIAAWTRREGRSWFFKMTGPGPLVESQKTKFLDFLRSIRFSS
jgi:hypothetical protein